MTNVSSSANDPRSSDSSDDPSSEETPSAETSSAEASDASAEGSVDEAAGRTSPPEEKDAASPDEAGSADTWPYNTSTASTDRPSASEASTPEDPEQPGDEPFDPETETSFDPPRRQPDGGYAGGGYEASEAGSGETAEDEAPERPPRAGEGMARDDAPDAFGEGPFAGRDASEPDPNGRGPFAGPSSPERSQPYQEAGSASDFGSEASRGSAWQQQGRFAFQMAKAWVKDNQTTAMLGAFAVGVFIGAITRD